MKNSNLLINILIAGLIAGTLDILAAFLNAYLSSKIMPDAVLKYIASGVFGKSAFSGGIEMLFLGLLFHFIIAFACTSIFYLVYPMLPFLKFSLFVNAILIGIVAWVIPTQIIIPMSQITQPPFDISKALVAILILIFFLGLPIAFGAKQFYEGQNQ